MLRILSPLFISGALGWLTLRLFFRPVGVWLRIVFYLAVGIPIGAGLFGLFSFLTFLFVRPGTGAILVAFSVPAFLLGSLGLLQASHKLFRPVSLMAGTVERGPILTILGLVCLVTWMASGLLLIASFVAFPHGMWDAHAIWNGRARVIFRVPEFWRDVFLPDHPLPDYPLTLSILVFTGWAELGRETQVVPFAVAVVFLFAAAGIAAVGLTIWKSVAWGLAGASLILCSIGYVALAGAEYADVPVSALFIASIVVFTLAYRNGNVHMPALTAAGLVAGLCGWMKNEGTVIVFGFTVGIAVVSLLADGLRPWLRQTVWFWLGAAPVYAVLHFYRSFAPANALVQAATGASVQQKLLNGRRWSTILKKLAGAWWHAPGTILPLAVLMLFVWIIAGIRVELALRRPLIVGVIALLCVAGAQFAAFLVTPYDLTWHLSTAADRLVLQLIPCFVFICFASANVEFLEFGSSKKSRPTQTASLISEIKPLQEMPAANPQCPSRKGTQNKQGKPARRRGNRQSP